MKKLVIIDGKSIFYRGYYAMSNLSLKDGTPTGGVYGFAAIFLAILTQLKPDNVIVAWDKAGTSIDQRTKIYPEYKANRKKPPEDFFTQIPILIKLLDAFNIPLVELDGYEADDLMGALAIKAMAKDFEVDLVTGDLDMLQLINGRVSIYVTKTGFSKIDKFDDAAFEKKYQIKVNQFIDFKALKGDSSDNIPGVPGIGPKIATELLHQFGSLEEIYNNLNLIKPKLADKLRQYQELAFMSKQLVRIMTEAPVEFSDEMGKLSKIDTNQALTMFEKLEFHSLKKRFLTLTKSNQKSSAQDTLFAKEESQLTPLLGELILPSQVITKVLDSQIVVEIVANTIYLSGLESTEIYCCELSKISSDFLIWFRSKEVIARDIKQFLHDLKLEALTLSDLPLDPQRIYDINQAGFLLDSLARYETTSQIRQGDLTQLKQVFFQQKTDFIATPKLSKIAHQFDFPLALVLYLIETRGVKIDQDFFVQFNSKITSQITQLTKDIHQLANKDFNVNSPQQLSQILFEELSLPTKGLKKTNYGYSTDRKTLDLLADSHEIINLIKSLRELTKLKTTYVDVLPDLTDGNNRLHTTLSQNVTTTGRLASSNPNLQNIPTRSTWGNRLRQGFIAESGKVLISADYSQFELRLAAVLSNDQEMLAIFNSGRDIHTEMAAQIYQVASDQVTSDQRRVAKIVNFSVLYGAGPRNLTQTVQGMDFKEAKDLIERYFEKRFAIKDFMEQTLEQAKTKGYVETFFGRRRATPDISSSNFIVREAAKRACINMPIQGTGADLMKLAMLKIEQYLGSIDGAIQILQIHDSILIECNEQNQQEVCEEVKLIMQTICPTLKVNLDVSTKVGKSWLDL